ncbi:histidine kinase [Nocardiopsis sp. RSe5-2]|uniref:Histidine kinase n=1 Tax=Nocardiopsis endophytica TaxID=3018445 RepID=A0ABT4U8H5_9ACTN|nr:histidine kinase [Nocardiopsis endophytica]MDA2813255.1 histidine kinase [Nocardiopsis endophytica]
MASTLAWGVTATVFGGMCVVAFVNVYSRALGPAATLLAGVCMAALFALQMLQCGWAGCPEHRRAARAVLALQLLIAFPPLLLFTQSWLGMLGFVAGSALLVLPRAAGITLFGAVAAGATAAQAVVSAELWPLGYTAVSTMVTGLVVYGLSCLRVLVGEMERAQARIADSAVVAERLRFARDLNGLVGEELSAIALKTELARRLVERDPERARHEVEEVLQVGRKALSDVRSVAHGYRDLSLAEEFRSVRSVLAAAGIRVRIHADHGDLPRPVGTLLATALREATTNVLRHARAEECAISVVREGDAVRAEVSCDGADPGAEPPGGRSGGLRTLSERAASLGGTLTAEYLDEGRFRLALEVPVPEPARSTAAFG